MSSAPLENIGTGLLRRYIGRRFEALRVKAGLTQVEAAKRIDRARTTIVRLEDGDEGVRFRETDVIHMLDVYGADEQDRELMLAFTAETRTSKSKAWWHDCTGESLPSYFALYLLLESSAETIRQYHSILIPGLLQTSAYADLTRQVHPDYSPGESSEHIDVRMKRQAMLSQPRAPHLNVILSEHVIRYRVGGPALMRDQLQHLLSAGSQNGISIRILPMTAGMHAGMMTSQFILMRFPPDPKGDPIEPPMAYVETLTGAVYLHSPTEIAAYDRVWNELERLALNAAESSDLIREVMGGLGDD